MATTYRAARVYTALDAAPLADAAVTVDGDRIVFVGPAAAAPEAPAVDLGDVTLLPGLIDCHVHLTFSASATVVEDYLADSDELRLLRGAENARRALLSGVTTVRECGGANAQVFALRSAAARGLILAPRIVAAGAPITTTGGHCWFWGLEADGPDALLRAVRAQVKAGADYIKVMATGGALTPRTNPVAPQYSEAELRAIVDDARRLGLKVAAHCHGTQGIINAARAGVLTIEHCSFQSAEGLVWDDDAAAAVLAAAAFVCPTLAIAERASHGLPDDHPLSQYRRISGPTRAANLRRLFDMGVPFISGSDAGVTLTPFEDFVYNITLLVERVGLTAHQAIQTATLHAGRALGRPDLGALAPGMAADLLAVAGDPLAAIGALWDVRCVVARGERVR